MLAEFYSKEGNMNTNLAMFYSLDSSSMKMTVFTFVQKDGQTYALAKEEGQHTVGDTVKGFAYTDMKQKLRLTYFRSNCHSGPIWLGTCHRGS